MALAFGTFDEPHAWLIRGLVEYGWPDVTRTGGFTPPGAFGGFNLGRILAGQGEAGVGLEIPAVSGGRALPEDGTYQFQVQVVRLRDGQLGLGVRCPEANFVQELPYDRANPLHAAGYLNQALQQYVSEFVAWRHAGGEVTWAQRAGIPTFIGEPPSPMLVAFIQQKIASHERFDQGPGRAWWITDGPGGPSPLGPPGRPAWGELIQSGQGGGDPVYLSAEARAEAAREASRAAALGVPGVSLARQHAERQLKGPAIALMVISGLGLLQGLLWIINAFVTIWVFGIDRPFAVLFSFVLGLLVMVGGAVSLYGARKLLAAERSVLVYAPMIYAALLPICCLPGLPISIWALLRWRDPMVREARK